MRKGIYKDNRTGTWYITTRIKINDKYHTVTKRGYLSKGDADNAYTKVIEDYIKAHSAIYKAMTFDDLINEEQEDRLTEVKLQTLDKEQCISKKYMLNQFSGMPIKEVLNKTTVQLWYRNVLTLLVSTDRKNRIINIFKNVLRFAYQHFYIDPNTFQECDVILRKIRTGFEIKEEKQIYSREEYEMFMDAIPKNDKYYILFSLFFELGCRIGELQGLQWKHFNEDTSEIYICQQVIYGLGNGTYTIDTPKTATSVRYNKLTDSMCSILKEYKEIIQPKDNDFLFFGKTPISRHAIRNKMHYYSKKAGIKYITPHGIRHSNTTWLLGNTSTVEDVKVVSKRLGHSSTQITLDTYAHILHSNESSLLEKSFEIKKTEKNEPSRNPMEQDA